MEVRLAKTAGFCFGVRRAVDTVYEQVEQAEGPIYTYGPIVHNEIVVQELEEKGVKVLNSEEELKSLTSGTVIIRAHGVGEKMYDLLKQQGVNLVDATCPFVKKIHRIARKELSHDFLIERGRAAQIDPAGGFDLSQRQL